MLQTKPTKERILEVATDLFSRDGFSAVSIRDITREVGIKESSLYNHFPSKDAILERILTDLRTEYRQLLPPIEALDQLLTATTPEQFLHRGLQRLMQRLEEPTLQKMWRIVHMEQFRNAQARDIVLEDLIGYTLEFLEAVFTRLVAMGKVKPLEPRVLAATYQYPVFSMTMEWTLVKFAGQDAAAVEQRMTDHIALFLELVKQPDQGR